MLSVHPSWSKICKWLKDKGVMTRSLKNTYSLLLKYHYKFFSLQLSLRQKITKAKIQIGKRKLSFVCFFPSSRLLLTIFTVIGYH